VADRVQGIYHGETFPLAPLQATHAWSFGPQDAVLGAHAAGLAPPHPVAAMQDAHAAKALNDAKWRELFAANPQLGRA
jgi:hypothetical protein